MRVADLKDSTLEDMSNYSFEAKPILCEEYLLAALISGSWCRRGRLLCRQQNRGNLARGPGDCQLRVGARQDIDKNIIFGPGGSHPVADHTLDSALRRVSVFPPEAGPAIKPPRPASSHSGGGTCRAGINLIQSQRFFVMLVYGTLRIYS